MLAGLDDGAARLARHAGMAARLLLGEQRTHAVLEHLAPVDRLTLGAHAPVQVGRHPELDLHDLPSGPVKRNDLPAAAGAETASLILKVFGAASFVLGFVLAQVAEDLSTVVATVLAAGGVLGAALLVGLAYALELLADQARSARRTNELLGEVRARLR